MLFCVQVFGCVHQLEQFSSFHQITQSLQTSSAKWREYFFIVSWSSYLQLTLPLSFLQPALSLLDSTPLNFIRLGLSRKLLLWKVLRFEKVRTFVIIIQTQNSNVHGLVVVFLSPCKLQMSMSKKCLYLCILHGLNHYTCIASRFHRIFFHRWLSN